MGLFGNKGNKGNIPESIKNGLKCEAGFKIQRSSFERELKSKIPVSVKNGLYDRPEVENPADVNRKNGKTR